MTNEDIQCYTTLIDRFLAAADMEKVSAKEIRQELEKKLGRDLRSQKVSPSTTSVTHLSLYQAE